MKCPRCVQRIHRAAASCPHCGFAIADADASFGLQAARLRRLTDKAGVLRCGDRERVEAALERISRRLPQLFAAVYTGALGEAAHIRQFGFWLLNRATFVDVAAGQPNDAGILLTLDPAAKTAGMVFGYLLDPYLEESDTFECLSRGHAYWLEERYADGFVNALSHLEGVLCKRSRQARRHPKHYQPKFCSPAVPGVNGIQSKQANQPAAEEISEGLP